MRPPGEKAQIRSSMDMVRVYNYGPQSLQQSNNNPTLVVICILTYIHYTKFSLSHTKIGQKVL